MAYKMLSSRLRQKIGSAYNFKVCVGVGVCVCVCECVRAQQEAEPKLN